MEEKVFNIEEVVPAEEAIITEEVKEVLESKPRLEEITEEELIVIEKSSQEEQEEVK